MRIRILILALFTVVLVLAVAQDARSTGYVNNLGCPPASPTSAGCVTTGTQTFAGNKTFTGAPIQIQGAGQTSASTSTSSSLGAALALDDTGAGVGNGGMVLFGAVQGRFATIKGYITNGSNNTQGDLVISTRAAAADATLTERFRITPAGITVGSGTPISKSVQNTLGVAGGNVAAGGCTDDAIVTTGSASGGDCSFGLTAALPAGVYAYCSTHTAGNCNIKTCNTTAGTVTYPANTLSCRVFNP